MKIPNPKQNFCPEQHKNSPTLFSNDSNHFFTFQENTSYLMQHLQNEHFLE
jgi:hypothetical protein